MMRNPIILALFSSLVALCDSGRTLRQSYGPPDFTPGKPLDSADFSASNNCPPNDPIFNKELVRRSYDALIGEKQDLSMLDKFFHEDYIQHNPLAADGREALRKNFEGPYGKGPITILRMAAEDDLVFVHFIFPVPGRTYATVDILRIECGRIKEHWDVLQDTDLKTPAANPHPFF